MLDKTTIGKNIANTRAKKGIRSQQALADLMQGYSRSQISQYEAGKNLPPLDFLSQFFALTGTSFEEIVLGISKPTTDYNPANVSQNKQESVFVLLDQLQQVSEGSARDILVQKLKTLIGIEREEYTSLSKKYIALLEKHEDFVAFVKKEFKVGS